MVRCSSSAKVEILHAPINDAKTANNRNTTPPIMVTVLGGNIKEVKESILCDMF